MRVAIVDGLVTLYYDGSRELFTEELHEEWMSTYAQLRLDAYFDVVHSRSDELENWESWDVSDQCKRYLRERLSWQQVIIIDSVTEIPERTFTFCKNIRRVIFSNTVTRIGRHAFSRCKELDYIKWSMNLQFIGEAAFSGCDNISSVFIPSTCREIRGWAFQCKKLSIFNVPQNTELGRHVISNTALAKSSPFNVYIDGSYESELHEDMNQWLKNMNNDEAYALHRACSSFQQLKQVIHIILQEKGLKAFREENSAGITPSRYLKENPYTTLDEKEIIHEYLMKMMGEVE